MKVLIHGYFGFGNAGDEMIYSVLRERLREMGFEVLAIVRKPSAPNEFDRSNLVSILKAIARSDIVISGGGGLLQDSTSFKSLLYYAGILLIGKALRKKTVVFAQGVGPLKRKISRFLLRIAFEGAQLATVRDEESKKIAVSCGVKKNIHVTADLAFLFGQPVSSSDSQRSSVTVLLKGLSSREYKEKLKSVLTYIKDLSKGEVILVPMYPEQDKNICLELAEECEVNFAGELTLYELLTEVSKSYAILGMRYHSLVLAIMNGVPFVAVAYDPKVKHLSRAVGMKCFEIDELSSDEFRKAFKELLENREALSNMLKARFEELRNSAEENFAYLRAAISSR